MHRSTLRIVAQLMIAHGFISGVSVLESRGDEDVLQEVLEIWEARRSAITTVYIKARGVRQAGDGVRNLTPNEVAGHVRAFEESMDAERALRELVVSVQGPARRADPPWGEVEFATDGERRAETGLDPRGLRYVSDGRADIRWANHRAARHPGMAAGPA